MYDFTTEDVVREVRHLAEKEPDFVYTEQDCFDQDYGACYYTSADGQGNGRGCIVGQALGRLGVSPETLRFIDGSGDSPVELALPPLLPSEPGDSRGLAWLSEVQNAQDLGVPWGTAVKGADDTVEYLYGPL